MFALENIDHCYHIHKRIYLQKDGLQDLCFDQMSDWIQQHMSHYLAHARVRGTMVYSYRA